MRKSALLLAIILIAGAASAADAASTKRKPAEPEDPNANSKKFLVDALPLMMPSAVMFYMLHQKEMEAKAAQEAKAKKSGKK